MLFNACDKTTLQTIPSCNPITLSSTTQCVSQMLVICSPMEVSCLSASQLSKYPNKCQRRDCVSRSRQTTKMQQRGRKPSKDHKKKQNTSFLLYDIYIYTAILLMSVDKFTMGDGGYGKFALLCLAVWLERRKHVVISGVLPAAGHYYSAMVFWQTVASRLYVIAPCQRLCWPCGTFTHTCDWLFSCSHFC